MILYVDKSREIFKIRVIRSDLVGCRLIAERVLMIYDTTERVLMIYCLEVPTLHYGPAAAYDTKRELKRMSTSYPLHAGQKVGHPQNRSNGRSQR
jgi:hypothetical protein